MGKKIHLNGSNLPDWKDCDTQNWGKYYFSYDVGQGFNDLYNPNHKLNHKFVSYWQKVAKTFKNNPYVIAYELINEPFIGNFWRDPLLVVPSMG
jgi:endoglycosylceramidase